MSSFIATVDARLQEWRQGDVALGVNIPFVYLADYDQPITPESQQATATNKSAGGDPLGTIVVDVPGLVVLTQTCDLVRSSKKRALVQVAALALLDADAFEDVRRGYRPRYAFIPGVADQRLAADLDSVMTLEKAIVAAVPPAQHVRGCRNDNEVREFALALARNASRSAFPDDFVTAVKQIQARILSKHGKPTFDAKGAPTNEGALLGALREIRVSCTPTWTAAEPTLTFFFIFPDGQQIPADGNAIVAGLLKRFKPTGFFTEPSFRLLRISEMSAAAYLSSHALDLDHLSHTERT